MRTQDPDPPCGLDPTFDFEAVAQLPEAVKLEQNGTPKLCEAVHSQLLRAGRPLDRSGDRWEGPLGGASTARPLEACERLMSGFLQRHGPLPRHARTLKTTWCAWQWRPPLPSALPRGRPVASERAAWWCCWWQILRPDRRLRPPALSSLPYRPRVIRHVRPLTEGVGEWRVATLQHTLSRERETLLSVSVLHALKTCVSARNVASEGDPDSGPERPLGARPRAQRLRRARSAPRSRKKRS